MNMKKMRFPLCLLLMAVLPLLPPCGQGHLYTPGVIPERDRCRVGQFPRDAEVYGVENSLMDFYRIGMDRSGIVVRIEENMEQAANAALVFPVDVVFEVLLAAMENSPPSWERLAASA